MELGRRAQHHWGATGQAEETQEGRGAVEPEEWRQMQYLILQIKESLTIPLAGTGYAEKKACFFLQQSSSEVPVPLAFACTQLLSIWQGLTLLYVTLMHHLGCNSSFVLYLYFCVSDVQISNKSLQICFGV